MYISGVSSLILTRPENSACGAHVGKHASVALSMIALWLSCARSVTRATTLGSRSAALALMASPLPICSFRALHLPHVDLQPIQSSRGRDRESGVGCATLSHGLQIRSVPSTSRTQFTALTCGVAPAQVVPYAPAENSSRTARASLASGKLM